MTPRLLRGGLSGRVFVVTRYREVDGTVIASTKYDVTDEFNLLVSTVRQSRPIVSGPAPNVPECTCDRDDDSWVGEPVDMPLCPYHEDQLRHLSWESLACMVIDYEAALRVKP